MMYVRTGNVAVLTESRIHRAALRKPWLCCFVSTKTVMTVVCRTSIGWDGHNLSTDSRTCQRPQRWDYWFQTNVQRRRIPNKWTYEHGSEVGAIDSNNTAAGTSNQHLPLRERLFSKDFDNGLRQSLNNFLRIWTDLGKSAVKLVWFLSETIVLSAWPCELFDH